jgi:hypothetical protein
MTENRKVKRPEIKEVSRSIKDILEPAFDILKLKPADDKEYIEDLHKIMHEIVKGAHYRFDATDLWELFQMDCVFIATRDSWLKQMPKNIITIQRIAANLNKPIIDVFIHEEEEDGKYKFDVRIVKPTVDTGNNKWF